MYRKQFKSRVLVLAGLALGTALVGCDAQSARILADIAQQARAAADRDAGMSDGGMQNGQRQDAQMPDGDKLMGDKQNSNWPNGDKQFGDWQSGGKPTPGMPAPMVSAWTADPSKAGETENYQFQSNPWFGGSHAEQCQDGRCQEEPRCYPGSRPEFDAEKVAVSGNPLQARDQLEGKWLCASGQGYLKLAVSPDGNVQGAIIFTASGREEPMMSFPGGTFDKGHLVLGGVIDGLVGRPSASASLEYLAIIRQPQGERLVRFTRDR